MPITTHDIRQTLLESDTEFRKLAEEHSRCEKQLKQLLTEPYLSSEDLALETTLKKIQTAIERSDGIDRCAQTAQRAAYVTGELFPRFLSYTDGVFAGCIPAARVEKRNRYTHL